jgi:Flp pilus assembly protein CpaB
LKSLAAPTLAPSVDWDKKVTNMKGHKKPANPLFLVLGLILLVLVGSAVFRASHEAPTEKFVQVVTTTRDTPAGTKLGLMNLHFLPVPKRYVTADMVTSLSYAAGSVARTYIAPGEPINHNQLFAKDSSLAMTLETHERAITLQMTDDALIDHCLNPDDRVDVLCISSNKDGKKFTRTIATDARVLMCVQKNQLLARRLGNSSANMVTLAVTPDLAEAVSEAVEVGKIRLVLRNRLTRIQPTLKGAGPDDLLPASAWTQEKDVAPAKVEPQESHVADAKMPPPPPIEPAAVPEGPVQWIVEMFSGSHKEIHAVPEE